MPKDVYIVRTAVVLLPLFLWSCCLIGHLHTLQIGRRGELLDKARSRYTGSSTSHSGRGEIRDVHGNLLAGNLACRDILAEPYRMKGRRDAVVRLFSKELGMDEAELRERFERACAPDERFPEIVLRRSCSAEVARAVETETIPGVTVRERQLDRADGFAGRMQELVAWTSRRNDHRAYDILVETSALRAASRRAEAFARLAQWVDCTPVRLEQRYQSATRNRTRPVEIVVRRRVAVDKAKDLRQRRTVVLRPAAAGDALAHTTGILARELDVERSELHARMSGAPGLEKRGRIVVAEAVSKPVAARISAYRLQGVTLIPTLKGVRFVESSKRFYPKGPLLGPILGFTNAVGAGVSGIEESFDSELKPHDGSVRFIKALGGTRLDIGAEEARDGQPGSTVYLTISEPIQQIAEEELQQLVRRFSPKAAYALMINPRSGAFMAMAQVPAFNPNNRTSVEDGAWVNRIAEMGFEPGSVVKPLAVSGAIDYGAVTLDTRFDCEQGNWFFCGRSLRDSGHRFGILTVAEILQHSSNIGAAKIALEMGEGRLYQTLRRYGFGQPTGIELQREARGIFRPLAEWDGLSISRFPIGQGVLLTPLQLVQTYAALANDGIMMQPYLVDRIRHPAGGVERTEPSPKRRVVRPPAARRVVEALKRVPTAEGTAPKAAIPGYEVAGKTGTAQKWVDGGYSRKHFVSTFIGFVPAESPAFVLMVTVDDPDREKGYYAGTVAAPTFRRIAKRTLRYLDAAPRVAPLTAPDTSVSMAEESAIVSAQRTKQGE